MNSARNVLLIIALILISPIILVLLCIGIIFGIIDMPFKKRRISKLHRVFDDLWMPNKKYFYLTADPENSEVEALGKEIFSKYEANTIYDDLSGTSMPEDYKKSCGILYSDVVQNYDCTHEICLVSIGIGHKMNILLPVYTDTDEETIDIDKTRKLFLEEIQSCLLSRRQNLMESSNHE